VGSFPALLLPDNPGRPYQWNEKGLAVALLADDESTSLRPSMTPQAGVNEIHIMRYILDTCATAGEAKEVLYGTKQYDEYAVAQLSHSRRSSGSETRTMPNTPCLPIPARSA